MVGIQCLELVKCLPFPLLIFGRVRSCPVSTVFIIKLLPTPRVVACVLGLVARAEESSTFERNGRGAETIFIVCLGLSSLRGSAHCGTSG